MSVFALRFSRSLVSSPVVPRYRLSSTTPTSSLTTSLSAWSSSRSRNRGISSSFPLSAGVGASRQATSASAIDSLVDDFLPSHSRTITSLSPSSDSDSGSGSGSGVNKTKSSPVVKTTRKSLLGSGSGSGSGSGGARSAYTRTPRSVPPSSLPSISHSPSSASKRASTKTTTSPSSPASAASTSASSSRNQDFEPESGFVEDDFFPLPASMSEIGDYANLVPGARSPSSASSSAQKVQNQIPSVRAPPGAAPTNRSTGEGASYTFEDSAHMAASPSLPPSSSSPAAQATADWSTSFYGLSSIPFSKEAAQILMRELNPKDVECKPDGLLYLPEIKYRRTLNEAFGPGGWGMAPRSETTIGNKIVSREWGLVCLGRLVAVARGEQQYFGPEGIPTATEACKSNALMRCCKDLGVASELWDPTFIRKFKDQHCIEVWAESSKGGGKKKLWRKKDGPKFTYPYKE